MTRLEKIQQILDQADQAYYTPGLDSIITDSEYDLLRQELKTLDPDDPRLTQVGSPKNFRKKIPHPIPMGSLDNTDKEIEGWHKWYNKIQQEHGPQKIILSLKMDGASVVAHYKSGRLQKVVTRGNGKVGDDITANGLQFQQLPKILKKPIDCYVRGEALLLKSDFLKVSEAEGKSEDELTNPRNIGNGVIGRKDGKYNDLIKFYAHNLYIDGKEFETESEKFCLLAELGLTPVNFSLHESQDIESTYNHVQENKKSYPFEIDGVVVIVDSHKVQKELTTDEKSLLRPKFARAIKFIQEQAVTTLVDVVLSVGHTGCVVPTAVVKPVFVDGSTITNVFLNNWDEIDRLGIAIGDSVVLHKSGAVIPKIIGRAPVDPEKALEGPSGASPRIPIPPPTSCPVCSSEVTKTYRGKPHANHFCTNKECPAVLEAKIDHWIGSQKKGIGILGIGDGLLHQLFYEQIVQTPTDLYLLKPEILSAVEISGIRVGDSRARAICESIQSKKSLELSVFLGALGIDLLGQRRAEIIIKEAKGLLDTLEQWLDPNNLRCTLFNMNGIGDITAEAICTGINETKSLILDLLEVGVTVVRKERVEITVSTNSKVAGKKFCFTGTRDLLKETEAAGGVIKSSVVKDLDYLVQKDRDSKSGKSQKAFELGVEVIGIDDLRVMLG